MTSEMVKITHSVPHSQDMFCAKFEGIQSFINRKSCQCDTCSTPNPAPADIYIYIYILQSTNLFLYTLHMEKQVECPKDTHYLNVMLVVKVKLKNFSTS